jgi:MATE family multidrug resistance protein
MILCLPIIIAVSSTFMHPTSATQEAMATYVSIRMLSAPVALINYSILGLVLGRGQGLVGLGSSSAAQWHQYSALHHPRS